MDIHALFEGWDQEIEDGDAANTTVQQQQPVPPAQPAPPVQPQPQPAQQQAAQPPPAAAALEMLGMLADEDDYDDDYDAGPAPVAPVHPAPAPKPVAMPLAVRLAAPVVQPQAPGPAPPSADALAIKLPVLAKAGTEAVLQLSEVFGTTEGDMEKVLGDHGEDNVKELELLQALKERRRQRHRQLLEKKKKQLQGAAVTPEAEEDELQLLGSAHSDTAQVRHWQQERRQLARLGVAAVGGKAAAAQQAADAAARLEGAKEFAEGGVRPGLADDSRADGGAPHLASRPAVPVSVLEPPLDPMGAPLVPAHIQRQVTEILEEDLLLRQAPKAAEDVRTVEEVDDPYLLGVEPDTSDSQISSYQVGELLGAVPEVVLLPASTTAWEDDIQWEVPGHDKWERQAVVKSLTAARHKPPPPQLPVEDPAQEENLSATEQVFRRSVAEALAARTAAGGQAAAGRAAAVGAMAGGVLGRPRTVFGTSLHPQMLRLEHDPEPAPQPAAADAAAAAEGGGGAPAAGAGQPGEAAGAGVREPAHAAPINDLDSHLRRYGGHTALLDRPEVEWEADVAWEVTGRRGAVGGHGLMQARARDKEVAAGGGHGAGKASAKAPPLLEWLEQRTGAGGSSVPLLLDLNDPHMAFRTKKADELAHAAALILPPVPKMKGVTGPAMDEQDPVAKDLARFNVSKDSEYGYTTAGAAARKNKTELRDSAGNKALEEVKHAVPALTLSTFPMRLEDEELAFFHRPRCRWHPSELQPGPQTEPVLMDTEGAARHLDLALYSLTGRKSVVPFGDYAWASQTALAAVLEAPQIKTRVAKRLPELFTDPQQVYSLVEPSHPLDPALPVPGLDAVQRADLAVVYNQVKLLLSKEANVVPSIESNKPNRPPAAFSKKPELTARDGHILLLEYMEERPALLGRPGMGVRLVTYYKKKDDQDVRGNRLQSAVVLPNQGLPDTNPGGAGAEGDADQEFPDNVVLGPNKTVEKWKVGNVQQLNPTQESPFMGAIPAGKVQLSVETMMFRAPAMAHPVQPTDFLLIRGATGTLALRELTGTVFVGQQQPFIAVPDPEAKSTLENVVTRRMIAHVVRELRKKIKKPPPGQLEQFEEPTNSIRLGDIIDLFGDSLSVADIKKVLVTRCGCQVREGTDGDDENAVYEVAPGATGETMNEKNLREFITPDVVAAHEGGLAAEQRLKQLGLQQPRFLANVHPDLVKMAIEMLPLNDPQVAAAAELIEHEIAAGLPWRTTESFLACVNDKSRLLYVDYGPGDPTGRGHAFSYILKAEPLMPPEAQAQQAPAGAERITGSDSDLRKLSNDEAAKILRQFGIDESIISGTKNRWRRIDMIRQLCTVAAGDPKYDELTKKYSRVIKYSFTDHLRMLKDSLGAIWTQQIQSLSSDQDNVPAVDAEAMRNTLRAKRLEAFNKGVTSAKAKQAQTLTDEQAEYLAMQREGFFENGAGAPSGAAGAAAAGAGGATGKPGERRIRRVITWKDAQGQTQKREMILTEKVDMWVLNTMCNHQKPDPFVHRTLKPPTVRRVKGTVHARLRIIEVSKAKRTGPKGKGARAAAAVEYVPAALKLPSARGRNAKAASARASGRARRTQPDEVIDVEEGDEEFVDVEAEGGRPAENGAAGPSAPKKPRAPRKASTAQTLVCADCGEKGHEAGAANCRMAYINPDDLDIGSDPEPADEEDGAADPGYTGPTSGRAERRRGARGQRGAGAGDDEEYIPDEPESPPHEIDRKVARGNRAAQRRRRAAGDDDDEDFEDLDMVVMGSGGRAKRKTAQAAVAGFKKRGRAKGSDDEWGSGADEDEDGWLVADGDGGGDDDADVVISEDNEQLTEEDEDPDMMDDDDDSDGDDDGDGGYGRKKRGGGGGGAGGGKKKKGKAPLKRAGSQRTGTGSKRGAAAVGAGTRDTAGTSSKRQRMDASAGYPSEGVAAMYAGAGPSVPPTYPPLATLEAIPQPPHINTKQLAAMPGGAEALNTLSNVFKNIINTTKKMPEFINLFKQAVSLIQVPDYRQWVPEGQDMYLEKISNNAKSKKYASREHFMVDVRQIVINAQRYNTPGHGKIGGEFIIVTAYKLMNHIEGCLDEEDGVIRDCERVLLALHRQQQGQVAAPLGQHAAAPASAAAAAAAVAAPAEEEGEAEGWVCCDSCNEWRKVPPEYQQQVEAMGQDAKWYCYMKGFQCGVPS